MLMEGHLNTCFKRAVASKNAKRQNEMIKEILNRTEGRVIENLHISKRREINFSFSMSPPAQTGYNLETIPFLLPMFCVILSF